MNTILLLAVLAFASAVVLPDELTNLLNAVNLKDWYTVAALALTIGVQLVRKYPAFGQKFWQKVPDGWRWVPVVLSAAVIGFVEAWARGAVVGQALVDAVIAVIGVGVQAMGFAALLRESPVKWDGGAGGKKGASIVDAGEPEPLSRTMKFTRHRLVYALVLLMSVPLVSCSSLGAAAVSSASSLLAEVLLRSQQASTVIDMIEARVGSLPMPPDLAEKVKTGIAACRAANAAAVAAARGADLTAKSAEAAFEPFRKEWAKLQELLKLGGVMQPDGRFKAEPGQPVIPAPLALEPF